MGTSPSGPPPLCGGGEVPQGAGCHGATLRAVGAQELPSSCRGLCPGSASPGPAGVIQLRLCAFPPLTSPRGLARGFTARVCFAGAAGKAWPGLGMEGAEQGVLSPLWVQLWVVAGAELQFSLPGCPGGR